MKDFIIVFVAALLLVPALLSQPRRFLDELPQDTREPLDALYSLVVEGQLWQGGGTFTEDLLTRIESMFDPMNPRDGEWGVFDRAISANNYAAHDFFDTLEISLDLIVLPKDGTGSDIALIDFEKPRRALPDTPFILADGREREAVVTLRVLMVLNLVLRKTRGMHSILS